jgi:hypothetical protein
MVTLAQPKTLMTAVTIALSRTATGHGQSMIQPNGPLKTLNADANHPLSLLHWNSSNDIHEFIKNQMLI